MKSSVETLEATKVKISVEVPYDELKPALDEVYKDLGQQITVPGFRKGHVPAQIIDRRIGRGYVIEQAVNQHLGEYYAQAIAEHDLQPLGQPEVEVTELPNVEGAREGNLAFTAEVEVLPDLEIPALEGVEVEVAPVEVTDEQVDEEVDALRKRFGSLKTVEREAKDGDFTSIDLTATQGGETIDSMAGVSYEIGSGSLLEGIDEALIGLKAGETGTFTSQMRGGEHAGEDAEVTVELKSVKERELPEVDEDFVQMASEFDTVDEMKDDIRENLKRQHASEQAIEARDKVMEHLRDTLDVPLPEGVLQRELDNRLSDDMSDDDKSELTENLRGALRDQIILDCIVRSRKVEVGQRELFDYILHLSQSYGIDPMQVLGDQQQVAGLHEELSRNKGVARLLREVSVKDTDGNPVDLSAFTKEHDEDAAEEGAKAAAAAAAEAADEA